MINARQDRRPGGYRIGRIRLPTLRGKMLYAAHKVPRFVERGTRSYWRVPNQGSYGSLGYVEHNCHKFKLRAPLTLQSIGNPDSICRPDKNHRESAGSTIQSPRSHARTSTLVARRLSHSQAQYQRTTRRWIQPCQSLRYTPVAMTKMTAPSDGVIGIGMVDVSIGPPKVW